MKMFSFSSGTRTSADEVEVLTWVQCGVNGHSNSNTKLYGDKCIQGGRNPFVLPRDRVSSVTVRMS